jgi:hypothetical protein
MIVSETEPAAEVEEAASPEASPEPEPLPAPRGATPRQAAPPVAPFPIRSLSLPRGAWPDPPPRAPAPVVEEVFEPEPEPVFEAEPAFEPESELDDEPIAVAPPEPTLEPEPTPAPAALEPVAFAATTKASTSLIDDDDWFERALAGLDESFEQGLAEARAGAVEPAPATPSPAPRAEEAVHHAPPAAPETPKSLPSAAEEERVEIGRYETEGTLYIMYADGSIDARSAGTVYRFESLAALKAHIETVA